MNNQDEERKNKLKYFALYLMIVFVVEYFMRDHLYNFSLNIIPWMQRELIDFIPFEFFMTQFGSERGLIVIMFFFYNYMNVYKAFILLSVISTGTFISGFLKLYYTQGRPYLDREDIVPYQCEAGWANPSGHALVSVSSYLTMWKLIFYDDDKVEKDVRKDFWLKISILIIVLICYSRMLLGVHGLNQILFGVALGLALYHSTFHLLSVNPNDPGQLIKLLTTSHSNMLFINLVIWILYTLNFYVYGKSNIHKEFYNEIVEMKGCGMVGISKRFENDAYLNCLTIHFIWAALIGIKLEYENIFNSNSAKWMQYNFGIHIHENQEPLLPAHYDYQWNHTVNTETTLRRTVITMIYFIIAMIPYFIISYNYTLFIVVIFKILIPVFISLIVLFSYFKIVLDYFNATNVKASDILKIKPEEIL